MKYFIHLPMKIESIVSSETSAIRTQTPGNYPKRNKLHLEHGESLKTSIILLRNYLFINPLFLQSYRHLIKTIYNYDTMTGFKAFYFSKYECVQLYDTFKNDNCMFMSY